VLQDVPKRLQFCINSWVLEPMDHLLLRVQWLSMQWPPSGRHLHEHKHFRVSAGTLETTKLLVFLNSSVPAKFRLAFHREGDGHWESIGWTATTTHCLIVSPPRGRLLQRASDT
jgi:hypothetical protein